MSQLSTNYITQIASLKKFPVNSQITSQGDPFGFIYLLYSGSVNLFKNIKFRNAKSNEIESLIKSPETTLETKEKFIFLEEVSPGFIIGAFEYFNHCPMQYTAICSMPCQIFVFDKYIFEKIDKSIIENYQKTLEPYVNDRVLKVNYFEDIRWNIFKKKLLKNIKIEKRVDKKMYLTERKPIELPNKGLSLKTVKLPKIKFERSKTQSKFRKNHDSDGRKTPVFN